MFPTHARIRNIRAEVGFRPPRAPRALSGVHDFADNLNTDKMVRDVFAPEWFHEALE